MSLQLALTQLESLAELLNERKRETEQYQAFRDTLRHVSGKFSLRPLADNNRYLLRQDNMNLVVKIKNPFVLDPRIQFFKYFYPIFTKYLGIQPKWDDFQNKRATLVVAQRPTRLRHRCL
jgi:hypothetical protein